MVADIGSIGTLCKVIGAPMRLLLLQQMNKHKSVKGEKPHGKPV